MSAWEGAGPTGMGSLQGTPMETRGPAEAPFGVGPGRSDGAAEGLGPNRVVPAGIEQGAWSGEMEEVVWSEAVEPTAGCRHGVQDPREFRLQRPEDYIEPPSRAHAVEPFADPRLTAGEINPRFERGDEASPWERNCADCARCFEVTWRGEGQEAAGLVPDGESPRRTEAWAGEQRTPTSPEEVRSALEAAGHGASAIVGSDWEGPWAPGGHDYNVVNFHGEILTVDSQSGRVMDFSRLSIHPSLENRVGLTHDVIMWNSDGRRVL